MTLNITHLAVAIAAFGAGYWVGKGHKEHFIWQYSRYWDGLVLREVTTEKPILWDTPRPPYEDDETAAAKKKKK